MDWKVSDYRALRLSNLHTPRFSHVKWLLFWPAFGILFALCERGGLQRVYHPVECALDAHIPFCEFFLIPYMFWFVYLTGMVAYTFLFEPDVFRKMMKFVAMTYTVTILVYFLYPTMQELRPTTFARDNFFTWFVARFYEFDTNTNVCPSIHVLGTFAAMYAAFNSRRFSARGWRVAFGVSAALICVSTVFLKQHSVIDVAAALPLCLLAYPLAFGRRGERAAALAPRRTDGEPA